jgi:hypothetical protein
MVSGGVAEGLVAAAGHPELHAESLPNFRAI